MKQTANQLLSMVCSHHTKRRDKTSIHFKTQLRAFEPSNSFNDQRQSKMTLSHLKRLPKLLRGIISKNSKNCYCVSFIILFKTANKLKSHEDVCKDHDNCLVKMPEARSSILNFNHGEKYLRKLLVIYASTECLLEKNKNKQIKNK